MHSSDKTDDNGKYFDKIKAPLVQISKIKVYFYAYAVHIVMDTTMLCLVLHVFDTFTGSQQNMVHVTSIGLQNVCEEKNKKKEVLCEK